MRRRDFLKGSLTLAGLGFVGCPSRRESSPNQPLSGRRVDPSYHQAHKLFQGSLPSEASQFEECEGLILGGGIAGLSAGWRWTRAGFSNYQLLELESKLGGNSRCLEYPASKAPIAAHYLPPPNVEAKAVRILLREMGILTLEQDGLSLREDQLCHSRHDRLYFQGRWHEGLVPTEALGEGTLAQLKAFTDHIKAWGSRRDSGGKKVFALPLHYSSREPEFLALDKISFGEYAKQQGWNDEFLLWYLEYACRDDFGGNLDNCSAWAGLHYFASRDGGALADPDDVLTWPEGNNRLVQHLQANQAGKLLPDSLVISIRDLGKQGALVDYLRLADNTRVQVKARSVVFCLPTFVRKHIFLDEREFKDFVYPPWLTANLVLDKVPQDLEAPGFMAWDNVIYQSPSLGYVVATHQNLNLDPLKPTVWTWYRPFAEADPQAMRQELLEADWEKWSHTILDELVKVHPDIRECCRLLDVTVLGHGMIRPSVGFVWGEQIEEARRSRGMIHFGHGDLSGMSLFEESQFRGVLASENAMKQMGLKFDSFL